MYKPKNKRKTLTKRLIQESLLSLLKEKNIHKISITELCEAAEINRTTFYSHYDTQYDVLEEIKNSLLFDLQTIVEKNIPSNEKDSIDLLEKIILYLKQTADVGKIIFETNDVTSSFATKFYQLPITDSIIKQHLSNSYNNTMQEMVLIFIFNGAYSLIRHWILSDSPITPRELATLIFQMGKTGWISL